MQRGVNVRLFQVAQASTNYRAARLWLSSTASNAVEGTRTEDEQTGGKRRGAEKLWQEFFSDPSQWWDHRSDKADLKFPDFKHKKRKKSLWLNSELKPFWVDSELAAIAPGTLQSSVFSWNQKLSRCIKAMQYEKTFDVLEQMELAGVNPDTFSFVRMISACAGLRSLQRGKTIHARVNEAGFDSDVHVGNCLVNMYMRCGSIKDAWDVFSKMQTRNVVAWNAMILGYVKCGQGLTALELFQQMHLEEVEADPVTFVALLNACASVMALDEGRFVHKQIIQSGFDSVLFVGSTLVDMYAKCGSIEEARNVFDNMPARDVVSWSAMILGYVRCGQSLKALKLYREMQQQGMDANAVTYLGLLSACANVAALEEGRLLHERIIQNGFESDIFVCNSLVDMYCKCGSIEEASRVFNNMPKRDVVGWNALIGGYAMHGKAKQALLHFERMCQERVEITGVTFLCLLSACNHAGLVEEGLNYFESMSSVYNITPSMEHYSSVVDLLGRAGWLGKAEELIEMMPSKPNAALWMSLLSACRVHGNVEIGERAAKRVRELDPENASGYVVLSNIYAAAGKWVHSAATHRERLETHVKKVPGLTWIEMNGEVHSFIADDQEHAQIKEIHAELERLSVQMEAAGYVPDTRFVLHDVDEEQKLARLGHHSEKLAIGYGLIRSPAGTPIRIFKNLRVCGDCHTAFKFISQITMRVLIVRDGNRFHHFEGGVCSCMDYW